MTELATTEAKQPTPKAKRPITRWEFDLLKFQGEPVTVTYQQGEFIQSITGIISSWNFHATHLIIDTADEDLMIRMPLTVSRAKKNVGGKGKSNA